MCEAILSDAEESKGLKILVSPARFLVTPYKTTNYQRVIRLSFTHTPPSHHISHHAHYNSLNYCTLCVLWNTYIYLVSRERRKRIEMYYQFNKQGFCALFTALSFKSSHSFSETHHRPSYPTGSGISAFY